MSDVDAATNFSAVTGADHETALRYLRHHGFDQERAVNAFLEGQDPGIQGGDANGEDSAQLDSDPPRMNNVAQAGEHAGLMGSPYIRFLARLWSRLLAMIVSLLGMIFNTGAPPRTRQEIEKAHADTTRKFIDKFRTNFVPEQEDQSNVPNVMPPFHEGSYRQAIDSARRNFKMILVYLHSDRHPDTPAFCRTLCEPTLATYLRDNFVLWGGSIYSEEAYQNSSLLHATTFPFLAVIMQMPSDRSKYVALYAHEGPIAADTLRTDLERVLEENGAELIVARNEQEERDMARTLREQQDREFEETARADRERMEAREAEERRAKEEQERVEREAREAIEAAEAAAKQAELAAQMRAERRQQAKDRLRAEPAAGAASPSAGGDVYNIQFRLPDGSACKRRFLKSDTVADLRNFVVSLDAIEMDVATIQLVCNYPKRTLTDDGASLEDQNLNGETVFVQEGNGA